MPLHHEYVVIIHNCNDGNVLYTFTKRCQWRYIILKQKIIINYDCFYGVEWDCFSRGNKEWVVIGRNKETIEKWAEQFTKSGCQVIVTEINKM